MAITFQIENKKGQKGNISQKVALAFIRNEKRNKPLYFAIEKGNANNATKKYVEGEISADSVIVNVRTTIFDKPFRKSILNKTDKDVSCKSLMIGRNFEKEDILNELMKGLGIEPKLPQQYRNFVIYDFSKIFPKNM